MLAKRREHGLVVRELDGETLVYDRSRHKAHCLNPAAALVWRHCDGCTAVAELARLLHDALALPADPNVVWLALDRLARAHLLEDRIVPEQVERFSRRDLARKLGVATWVVPLVMTILAPTAAAAASLCGGRPPCHDKTCGLLQRCQPNRGTCRCVLL